MSAVPFVPLRVFSCFSMLEGAIEPKLIAKQAKKLGFPAIALTDRNGLYAAMPFTDAAQAEGVQPIIGTLLAVARPADLGPAGTLDWLVLLAKDEAGYDNLCKLVSKAHLDRPVHEPPHVLFEALDGATEGLIGLTAGPGRGRRAAVRRRAGRQGADLCRADRRSVTGTPVRRADPAAAIPSRMPPRQGSSISLTPSICRSSPPIPPNISSASSMRRMTPCCASPIRPMSRQPTGRPARPKPG
jgi:hypothetical protein